MNEETRTPAPPGMLWIKLLGALAVVSALIFVSRIVWDVFREKPDADEEVHLGI